MSDIQTKGIQVSNLSLSYGKFSLFEDISFAVDDGEFMVIVGPSGCGKSSLMRVIAGIEEHSHGQITIDGVDVTNVDPGRRRIGMVFQDYALYPHMTVAQNLAFGLRSRRVARSETKMRVQQTAAMVGLSDQLTKKPAQLSGGQRQRVALARAIVQEPRAILMDEPLSNLDAALRVQMRAELIEFHRRVQGTVLYVTHDQVEAMTMGDRVAVMNNGRFEQVGTPQQVYDTPVNLYVASFLGSPKMNILRAVVVDHANGPGVVVGSTTWHLPDPLRVAVGSTVHVGIRPENLRLERSPVESSAFRCRVDFVENLGNEVIVHLSTTEGLTLVARSSPRHIRPGDEVMAVAPASVIHIFDDAGQAIRHASPLTPIKGVGE